MVTDFHTHILPPSFAEQRLDIVRRDATFATMFSGERARMATAEQLIDAMDQDGIERSVVLGYGWCDQETARAANDYALESAQRHPGRIVPFCSVHPGWGEAALAEVERCVTGGAAGIGELHPTSQDIDLAADERLADLMALAERASLPVVVHSSEPAGHLYPGKGNTHPTKLIAFAKRFPNVTIICAHWGGGLPFYALMPEVRAALTNVYFDTAASPFLYHSAVFPTVVKAVGSERVLFGSDYPLLRASRVRAQAEAELSPNDAQRLLSENATRLLEQRNGDPA